MKIKSIIMAVVLATTMTGCAELNNTLHVLAEQADAYRNGTSSNSLFKRIYFGENEEYCKDYYFCQNEGKGFKNFAYIVTEGHDFGNDQQAVSIHIGNNVAKLAWLAQKCYEETPIHLTCDNKYYRKIDEIFNKVGGRRQFDGQIITTDL